MELKNVLQTNGNKLLKK